MTTKKSKLARKGPSFALPASVGKPAVALAKEGPSPLKTRKIAVIGTTPHRANAPYDDPAWEIWGVGRWHPDVRRWDRWFEIHDLATLKADYDDHLKYLADSGKPVYVREPTPKIPNGVVYPRETIVERFGGTYFFTSTIAWMMALALHEDVTHLGLWGVDMATHGEYATQKPGCKHFIAVARLMGVDVVVSRHSDLLREPASYPEPESLLARKIRDRVADVDKHLEQRQAHLKSLELEIAHLRGMKFDLQYFLDNWTEER